MSAPDSTTARTTQLRHSLGVLLGGGFVLLVLSLSEHQGVRVTYE